MLQSRVNVSLLFVGLAIAGTSFFPLPTYAKTIGGVTDVENVSGLTSCTTVSGSALQNLTNLSCGDIFKSAGSFLIGDAATGNQVPYSAGDIAKCTWIPLTSSASCVVSHPDGTYTGYTTTAATGALTTTQYDSNGAIVGTPAEQSATDAVFTQPVMNAASTALSGIGESLMTAVATAVLSFANWLLGIAGVLFNLIMYYGVFQFGNTVGNSPGVLTAWGILRDLANMALLFGFIFMGIATILDTGAMQGFTAKKALPSLLIFAILMNFSLFTCEALIDISNALSSSMYAQANTDPCTGDSIVGSATQAVTGTSCGINYGLAGHIMQSTGLAGIWAVHDNTPLGVQAWYYFGLALFATIGAIVFFAASIMLAIRVVMLTLLMVVSPIGFAGMAIPPLRKLAGDWWTRVIHQAFYAPIMLLLILISLKIGDSFTTVGANNGLADAVTGQDASMMGVFLVFMLVIGFMIASLIIANRFGAAGASAAVGFGKKVVLGSYGGVAGFAGRRTVGAGTNWAQKKYNKSVASGRLQFLAGSKLDDAVLGGLKKGQTARFGSSKSFAEDKEHHEARHKELKKIERLNAVSTAGAGKDMKDPVQKAAAEKEMRDALKQLSDAEIAESDALKKGGVQLELIARSLSSEKFDKLMSNEKLSDDRKDEMRNARFKEIHEAVTKADEAAVAFEADPTNVALQDEYNTKQKEVAKMTNALSGKDIGQLASSTQHSSLFKDQNFSSALTDDQFKEARKNNNLAPTQIQSLETSRRDRQNDPIHVVNRISTLTPEAAGKLSGEVITKRDSAGKLIVLEKMSARQLSSIDPAKLTPAQATEVGEYVKNVLTTLTGKTADDFRRMYNTSPELQRRWP